MAQLTASNQDATGFLLLRHLREKPPNGLCRLLRLLACSVVRPQTKIFYATKWKKSVNHPDSSPRLLSAATVADRLEVSTKTIRRWIEAGALRVHRLGRCIRISEADLQDFIDQHRK